MFAKRLYAADARLALLRSPRIARAALRGLVFFGFCTLAVTSAQAQNVLEWTGVRIMFGWSDFNAAGTKIFDSV